MTPYNFKTELEFTETYKKYKNEHPAIREAVCLKVQFPAFFTSIQDGDLFAGRIKNTLVGITPDEWGTAAFGYYCVKDKIYKELQNPELDFIIAEKVRQMVKFWDKESTSARLRAAYPEEMAKYLPSDNWMGEPGISFPLYRLTGGNINWHKLLKKGIPGLIKEAEEYSKSAKTAGGDYKLYDGMKMALEVLIDVCHFYVAQAKDMAASAEGKRKQELEEMSAVLEVITVSAPENMREAIQLFWLYSYVADVRNYGRMDVYLGDFYVNDIKSGTLIEEKALSLLQSLWRLIGARNTVVHSRIIIGGKGRSNVENADKFALLAMEATRTVFEIEPQLSLRIYNGMNPALKEKALQVIGEGRTYPIIYNDEVNIKAVQNAFGFDEQTAEQYLPYGCGEYIIDHRSFGTPSGVINLLKALEVTMHNGIDPLTGRISGLRLGNFGDFKTFDDLWNAYTKQVEFFVRLMAEQEVLEYKIAGEHSPYLYLSMLYDNCMERGKAAFAGGIEFLGGTLETYGNTNTADSLAAIKELIYDKKLITHEELLTALDKNFDGFENLRQKLLSVPKYGNDNDTADNMLVKVHEHVCNYVKQQKERAGLHSYLVVVINNSANTLMGHWTAASPDGRRSGESMANGNNPSGGSDKNGVTAFLNSLVKPSPYIHAGAVQNMKFSKEMFTAKKDILKALLDTYYDNGGAQAMITVVDRNELEKALAEPEKYHHVFVRVGGFSARFVELSRDVQMEILSRTLY
jgi:pyruvate-formate lyase